MRACVLSLALLLGGRAGFALPVMPASISGDAAKPVSRELHENVVTLVELLGVRQHLLDSRTKVAEEGKQVILQTYPNYSPQFADEWAKRMVARSPVDEYLKIVVAAYEKNYSNDDVVELIQVQRDVKAGKTPAISAQLKEKITTAGIAAQSEIMGGFTQLGSKLGGEIGLEIAKEHPEWLKRSDTFTPAKPSAPGTSVARENSITPADSTSSADFVVTPAN